MKSITLSAKEEAIEKARSLALRRHRTLNELFREWLDDINAEADKDGDVTSGPHTLWRQTNYLRVDKKMSRDEMNER